MKKEFLLLKDKKKGKPPHIQAHLALPDTKANASQSQKSLHFANTPLIIQTFFILKNEILKIIYYFCGLIILRK